MTGPVERTPAGLLAGALAGDPARPLLTFYDDATGERVELSVATTANWVAKTAGLLTDDLDVAPGDTVRLELPRHWLAAVWALAAWRVGAVVEVAPGSSVSGPPTAEPAVRVVGPDGLDGTHAAAATVAVSLAPLGAAFAPGTLPPSVLDFAREVPAHADRWNGPAPSAGAPALRSAATTLDGAGTVARAEGLAERWRLGRSGRLLVAGSLDPVDDLLAATLVPLAVGGSVVLVRHGDPADRARQDARAVSERVTATAGPAAPTA